LVFSRQVGLWLSEKEAITDNYQKTKEMVQNWYKRQVSAHAIMPTINTENSKDSNYTSSRDDGYSEQSYSSVEDKIKCIFCNKNGHSAQVCRDWLKKQKSKKRANKIK
jgi:hypothetical protein